MGPRIGITSWHHDPTPSLPRQRGRGWEGGEDYSRAIAHAGGIPLILPIPPREESQGEGPQEALFDTFLDTIDGLLFTGGEDIHPAFYGEGLQERCGEIDQDRDHFEIELVKRAFNRRMPMLGICRGIQLFNVVLGGSLYQDLSYRPGTAEHHNAPNEKRDELIHKVRLVPESRLHQILGRLELEVTSTHHQVIKALAPGLKVSAVASDGVIEGVEAEDYPFLVAVQWHPERMLWRDPKQLGLFRALVEAARR